ncbi:hypothetical protein ACFVT8_23765 [Lysinibacillus sp. NPDC058147]|uniref:hypothetical protein n=1 Tax=unclassified Lysinibacillus TaxID=2636778 RepID=UPI0036DA27F9
MSSPTDALTPKVVTTVAKQLWPSMLFIVVMTLIAITSLYMFRDILEPDSIKFAFNAWFATMIIITGYATYVFVIDARVQFNKTNE